MAALPAGLRQLGYEEGRDLVFDAHWAEDKYERLPILVAELLQWKPDVLVASGDQFSLEIKKATTTIPIVSAGTIGAELSRDSRPGCKARLTAKPRVSVAGRDFSLFIDAPACVNGGAAAANADSRRHSARRIRTGCDLHASPPQTFHGAPRGHAHRSVSHPRATSGHPLGKE